MFIPEFNVPFYQIKVSDWENKKKRLLDVYSKVKNNLVCDDPVSFVYSDFRNQDYYNNYFGEITEILDEELNEFSVQSNLEQEVNITCWFQKYTEGCFHAPHTHGALGYSSVCFIEYDENEHKPTRFISPIQNPMTGSLMDYFPQNITEGTIIFFPAYLTHYVLPNDSKKIRIILSMNIKPLSR
jgi:RNAse (barnase) inhibitor barstar